ncbi:hypothetical protein KA344_11620 [bacterium]|nr:hypothetical protein [bacterium]
MGSGSTKNSFFLWLGLICLAPLTCLFLDLWQYPRLIAGGLAMRIVAANLLIKGELPYYDFWDWSQPIVFELLKYPYMLCTTLQTMQVPITHAVFIPLVIFGLVIGSAILTIAVCSQALGVAESDSAVNSRDSEDIDEPNNYRNFVISCLLGLVLTTLIARFDFGDLQYLFLLTIVPWFALRWFAHKQIKVQPLLAALVGIVAAIGACLDLPYIFVFVILELILSLQSGRWRCILSSEWLAFMLTIAGNLLFLSQLPEPVHTAFWRWSMPLKWLNYSIFDSMIYASQACPNRADIIYGMVAAGIVSFLLGKKYSIFVALPSLMFSGFALYLLEGQGSSHDLILTIFAITATFVSTILLASEKLLARLALNSKTESDKKPKFAYHSIVLILTLVSTTAIWQALEHDRANLQNCISVNCSKGNEQLETLLEQTSKVGDNVTVISQNIEPAYPLLFLSGRKPGGYLLWNRPLWLFAWLKAHSQLTGSMKDFYDHTYANIRSELEQNQTKVLILSNPEPFDSLEHEHYLRAIKQNFSELGKDGNFFSYKNHQPREYTGYNFAYRFLVRRKDKGI